jgi:iron complex outermembrane receptor protein
VGVRDRLGSNPYALLAIYAASSRGRVRPFLRLANVTGSSYQEIPGVQMPGMTVLGGVEILGHGH